MDKRTQYINFLRQKIEIAPESGLDIEILLIQFLDSTKLKFKTLSNQINERK